MKKIFLILFLTMIFSPSVINAKQIISHPNNFKLSFSEDWVLSITKETIQAINDQSTISVDIIPTDKNLHYYTINTMKEVQKESFRQTSITQIIEEYPQVEIDSAQYIQAGQNTFLLILYDVAGQQHAIAKILHRTNTITFNLITTEDNEAHFEQFLKTLESFIPIIIPKSGLRKSDIFEFARPKAKFLF